MKLFAFILVTLVYLSIQKFSLEYYEQFFKDAKVYFPQKDGVLLLTSGTIEEALKLYPKLAVLMYTPWCPHCKALYPEIVKALKNDEMKKMGVVFGRVDIEYNTKVRDDFKVYGMPTVLYFENGIRKEVYNGGRTADSIVEWFYKRLVSKTHLLKSLDEIKSYERPSVHKFVYFGNNPEKIQEYEKFIDSHGNTIFGLVKDEQLMKSYGKSPDTVVLFKNFDDPPYVDIKNITKENLGYEFKLNQYPLMYENCDDLLRMSFNYRLPSMILFRNDADKEKTPNLDKTYLKMANKHRSKILFCKSDISSEFSKRIIRAANITKVNAEKNEPSTVIFDFVKGGFNKWRLEDFFNECNSKNMEQLLQDWIDGKIKPPIKSEEIPTKQDGPVYKLVNKSFQKEVLDNDLNVFVKFYSPNCPHCVKLKPAFEELAEKLKNNKYLRIAEYNLKDNDFDWFPIRSYPTLILFKAGEKNSTTFYTGNRTVEDMMKFVLVNSGNSEEIIKKKEEEKRKKEEEEKRKKEEEERKRKEEEKKRREEEAKKRREEEERKRKLEEEKKRKEEEARKRREEEERKRKLDEENKRKEEELRKKKLEDEKRKKEEEAKNKESDQNNQKEKQKKKSEDL